MEQVIRLTVNGDAHTLAVAPNVTLLEVLRSHLGLTGTKRGGDLGDCGSCTVLMNGKPVNSCLVLAVAASGCEIVTIEGLEREGRVAPLQGAFVAAGGVQGGFLPPRTGGWGQGRIAH